MVLIKCWTWVLYHCFTPQKGTHEYSGFDSLTDSKWLEPAHVFVFVHDLMSSHHIVLFIQHGHGPSVTDHCKFSIKELILVGSKVLCSVLFVLRYCGTQNYCVRAHNLVHGYGVK